MLTIEFFVNENLIGAEDALSQASPENVVDLCGKYLLALSEFRNGIYKLQGIPEIGLGQRTALAQELSDQLRKTIRSVLEISVRERNRTKSLLNSFTSINGHQAVETFNRLNYRDSDDWQLGANSVRPNKDRDDHSLTMQEAIEAASLLRRKAYVKNKQVFF